MLGKMKAKGEGGGRGGDGQIASWTQGHESEQTPGDSGGGQKSLACYSPWHRKEPDMTWRLNSNTDINRIWSYVSQHTSYILSSNKASLLLY